MKEILYIFHVNVPYTHFYIHKNRIISICVAQKLWRRSSMMHVLNKIKNDRLAGKSGLKQNKRVIRNISQLT